VTQASGDLIADSKGHIWKAMLATNSGSRKMIARRDARRLLCT
jgi:hypothetical protein